MSIAVKTDTSAKKSDALSVPLAEINPGRTDRFQDDTIWPMFERVRREDPVHYTAESEYGAYWSVTRWNDIMAVESNHEAYSSAEGITLVSR